MSPDAPPLQLGDRLTIASITVMHDPNVEFLRRQKLQLVGSALRIVVDNASAARAQAELRELFSEAGAELLALPGNIGLAAAIIVGLRYVRAQYPAVQAILLLDQDTEPGSTGLDVLGHAYVALRHEFGPDVVLKPAPVDADTGIDHGFHVIRGLRWVRLRRLDGAGPVVCASLNCSGILTGVATFDRVGGMDESFFLDILDAEWSFRAAAMGVRLLGVPATHFIHRMGRRSLRVWLFGWRVIPYRSPWRNRLVVRNTLRLIVRRHAPAVWKLWAVPKLLLTMAAHGLLDRDRGAQLGAMLHGVGDAVLGRAVAPPTRGAAN